MNVFNHDLLVVTKLSDEIHNEEWGRLQWQLEFTRYPSKLVAFLEKCQTIIYCVDTYMQQLLPILTSDRWLSAWCRHLLPQGSWRVARHVHWSWRWANISGAKRTVVNPCRIGICSHWFTKAFECACDCECKLYTTLSCDSVFMAKRYCNFLSPIYTSIILKVARLSLSKGQ